MKLSTECLKGYYTVSDKNGNIRTYQSYRDPITDKLKKKGVGWKRKSIKSERQALRYLRNQIEIELFEQPLTETTSIETFGDLTDVWLSAWMPTVRPSTVDSQTVILNNYLIPFFSREMVLSKMKVIYVESVWAKILSLKGKRSKKPLEKATSEKIRSLLRQITYYGYRNEVVEVDL
ncbi:hypothetical protein IGI37_001416 [Enterococcus sp. AZ194]|uniref:hypothetical protein n=1 Tax=Enterococcus sp. AZ194 TaxID=2774629 RepID=UPI003F24331D